MMGYNFYRYTTTGKKQYTLLNYKHEALSYLFMGPIGTIFLLTVLLCKAIMACAHMLHAKFDREFS